VAAAIEKRSEHPLAQAILTYTGELDITLPDLQDFKSVPGKVPVALLPEKNA
jgi:cation transport ATPase